MATVDDRVFVDVDEAIRRLPAGDTVHTQWQKTSGIRFGATWRKVDLIDAIRDAGGAEESGPIASNAGYPLHLRLDGGFLFFEAEAADAGIPHVGEVS